MLITVCAAISRLTNSRRHRIGLKMTRYKLSSRCCTSCNTPIASSILRESTLYCALSWLFSFRSSFSEGEPKISNNTMKLPAPSPMPKITGVICSTHVAGRLDKFGHKSVSADYKCSKLCASGVNISLSMRQKYEKQAIFALFFKNYKIYDL